MGRVKDRPATLEEMASIEFEGCVGDPTGGPLPDLAEWGEILGTVRSAWRLLFKSKGETAEMVERLGDEISDDLATSLTSTAQRLAAVLEVVRSAEGRLLIGMSVAALRQADTASA